MSSSQDLRREVDRWKDKYFEQGEVFDEEKKFAEEYAGLLQRLLVRVSLAADNVSEGLDSELNALRNAIREASPRKNDLAKRLRRIDDLILKSDDSKQKNADKVVDALQQMVDQILLLPVSRSIRKDLKQLSKSFSVRASRFKEYPGILSELSALLAASLEEVVEPAEKEEGFFSRLMGNSSKVVIKDKAEPGNEQELAPQEEDAARPLVEISENDAELSVDSDEEDAGEAISTDMVPGFSSIASHIRTTLNNLLDQLEFPESAARDVELLRARANAKLNWYELGPTLDDLASLVLAVVGRGQRDFERFLLALDARLNKVQSYLTHSNEMELDWVNKGVALQGVVRTQVQEISVDLSSATEIEDLKRSITSHLDAITGAMDSYSQESERYRDERDAEMEAMRERLAEMEEESVHIRSRLKEARGKALTDKLTELPNREAYDERLELEIERWKRYKNPATMVVADVDHFKKVNDTYGHLSGDKVLQIIAKEIQNRIRKTDFVARYGGEEFVIILPETDLGVAQQVIDKTREMISRLPFHFKEESVQITMSFGLVAFYEGCSQGALFERADKALYQAKENGRNCVITYKDTMG